MGSGVKSIRKRAGRALRKAVAELAMRADRKHTRCDCWELSEPTAQIRASGWIVSAAVTDHTVPGDAPARGVGAVDHWHLVMQLYPPGRPEHARDWEDLGYFVRRFSELTGYEGPEIDPLNPLDDDPGAPHHFVWHAWHVERLGSTPLSPEHRRALARQDLLSRTPPEER